MSLPVRRSDAQTLPRCDPEPEHWLAVEMVGPRWSADLARLVMRQLEASFRGLDLATCAPRARDAAPLAHITLRAGEKQGVEVSVDISDAVTNKRVGRNIDVARLDHQAAALAVAVTVDELVRASWAELALEKRSTSVDRPAPPVVEQVVESSLRDPVKRSHSRSGLSAEAAGELFGIGDVFLGGDVVYLQQLGSSWALEVALGGRSGRGASTAIGNVETSAASGRLTLPIFLVDSEQWDLFAGPSAQALFVSARGEPSVGVSVGQRETALAMLGRFDVGGHIRLLRQLELSLKFGGGHTLLGAAVLAGEKAVAGAEGLVLAGAVGLGVAF